MMGLGSVLGFGGRGLGRLRSEFTNLARLFFFDAKFSIAGFWTIGGSCRRRRFILLRIILLRRLRRGRVGSRRM